MNREINEISNLRAILKLKLLFVAEISHWSICGDFCGFFIKIFFSCYFLNYKIVF